MSLEGAANILNVITKLALASKGYEFDHRKALVLKERQHSSDELRILCSMSVDVVKAPGSTSAAAAPTGSACCLVCLNVDALVFS
ncbi:hypothetical protein HPB50_018291 [Hyalomma asiaticum]|uniref:Uncharacterized protein n=1 Tax=Hyalomma asiaticum TaxID=266040 RepID=A0ACB7SG16_HYAAI|nr:hypothetical protein HPB50_018291 [Hyalomma asiaticum]